ncbi:MAG: 2-oxoglutarate dehydrogenase E1 component [Gammaproteobacteria bacterium]|nr:2-oxoglutarate dehydrogenase E1 component [Gammaproteobacteria bacterium]
MSRSGTRVAKQKVTEKKSIKQKSRASVQLSATSDISHLAGGNLNYLENIYGDYLKSINGDGGASSNATESGEDWNSFFRSLAAPQKYSEKNSTQPANITQELSYGAFVNDINALGMRGATSVSSTTGNTFSSATKQQAFDALVSAYRVYGHKKSNINPLQCKSRSNDDELKLDIYGLTENDLDEKFSAELLAVGDETMTLREAIDHLERTYCGSLATEFMYISERDKKQWVINKLETPTSYASEEKDKRLKILERLVAASGLEASLASKYPGTKRFGLEGGETLIPVLDELAQYAGTLKIKEIVLAMAHRGRLNVLVNILGKNPASLFDEFEGKYTLDEKFFGDVKYHQGFSSNLETPGGQVHLAMGFNPSHLEIVSPVAVGSVRARQDRREDKTGDQVIPIVIHGDASFSGQGVVMETLQMSDLKGFRIGGTVHIILNNQIGFTVSDVGDARSTYYASDVAKILEVPIFHVNGEDPDAVIFATRMALEYRMKYHTDVVIDLICYRRHGHNEADEPALTQPLMYSEIRQRPTVTDIYAQKLIDADLLSENDYSKMKNEYREHLDNGDHVSSSLVINPNTELFVDWTPYLNQEWSDTCDTSINLKELKDIGKQLLQLPDDFVEHRQVKKLFEDRQAMINGDKPVDWGCAELLAYGSLITKGHSVRMSGQDSRRGTFSHRQAVVHNQTHNYSYCPLSNMQSAKAKFQIFDSFLSEEAAMAFEYGYAATNPNALVLWEAQFGDFANGAQVVIDQFLSSGETKWQRLCGLVLLLPHGYEGQGPEHSSARLERFLQLCADNNMQVCVPSTAGQVFHMLRRQVVRSLRKPLVVMMPKSLLRKKTSATMITDLAKGQFMTVIPEVDASIEPKKVNRVILCSGKVYYELLDYRQEHNIKNTAILRIEQLYPFPHAHIDEALSVYTNVKYFVWCQEEPMNQGAWYSSKHHLEIVNKGSCPKAQLIASGRPHAASPAAGYMALHNKLQFALVEGAFKLKE